ncbi:MAG: hypothetical protein ACE5EW_02580 [Thermoplasmata archaeon]
MLTLEEEEYAQDLRRELVILLHIPQDRLPALRRVRGWKSAFAALDEVRSRFEGVSPGQAALRIAAPPFLHQDRLRPILAACLEPLLGAPVLFSIRILTELGETIQAAFDVEEEWLQEGTAPGGTALCFTDEHAAGEVGLLLSDLRTALAERLVGSVVEAFPLNHYDVLCFWTGPVEEKLASTEAFIAQVYGELMEVPVSATSRDLGEAPELLEFLGSQGEGEAQASTPD